MGELGGSYLIQINGSGGVTPQGPRSLSVPYVSPYFVDGGYQYHFAYRDAHGRIWDTFSKPDPGGAALPKAGEWVLQAINEDGNTAGPAAFAGPWVGTYTDQQHFTYLGADDHMIYDAFWDGAGHQWHLQTINSGNAATPPAGSPPFAWTYTPLQQHIAFFDESGTLWDCWYDGFGHWQAEHVNNGGRTSLPSGIHDLEHHPWLWQSSVFDLHYSYLGEDSAVYDAYYDGSIWQGQQITHGAPPRSGLAKTNAGPQAARPAVTTYVLPHFFVRDENEILRDCWLTSGWNLTQLNGAAGLFPQAGATATPPFAWSTRAILSDGGGLGGAENSSASVAYADRGGIIWSITATSMPETLVTD